MNGNSVLARALVAAGLAIGLGASAGASAQEPGTSADAPAVIEQSAAPSDQPTRRRDRRRNAETAAEAPAETAAATDLTETVEAKITCKNIKPIGSRVARRVCGTEEQWAAAGQRSSEETEEGLRQFRSRAGIGGAGSGPASLNTPASQ
jgi:hypothetical protein